MAKVGDAAELAWFRNRDADRYFIVALYPYKYSKKATEEIWLTTDVFEDSSQRDYRPVISGPITTSQSIPKSLLGASDFNGGTLQIDSSSQEFDSWMTAYSWGGREIRIFGVDPNNVVWLATVDYPFIFVGNITSIRVASENTIELTYTPEAGTTNVDVFGATLTNNDRRWPIVYGRVYNVSGKAYTDDTVADSNRIYKISRYPVEAIDNVYVSAVAQSFDANYGTLSSLVTAQSSLVAGEYATCLAEGLFAVHGSADGAVTCDIKGRNNATGGYEDIAGEIIKDIATESEITGEAKFPQWLLSTGTFNELNTQATQEIGFYLESQENVLDLVGRIIASVGGVFWWDNIGRMSVGVFTEPDPDNSIGDITETADILGSINIFPWGAPVYRYVLRHKRNHTIQNGDGLPATVDLSREFLAEDWSEASVSDGRTESKHEDAAQISEQSMIQQTTQAFAESARRLELLNQHRFIYRFRAWNRIGGYGLLETWRLFHDRFAPNGKYLRIISVSENLEERFTELELWG